MNKAQTRTFCRLFHSHKKQLLACYSFWVFSRSKIMTVFPTLSYTWSLKSIPFGAEPPRIGHRRENPPGTILVPWPRRFSWTNSAEWPWGPEWFALPYTWDVRSLLNMIRWFWSWKTYWQSKLNSVLFYLLHITPRGDKCHVNKLSVFF